MPCDSADGALLFQFVHDFLRQIELFLGKQQVARNRVEDKIVSAFGTPLVDARLSGQFIELTGDMEIPAY